MGGGELVGGIKYYQLAKGEELPDEFCAVKDVDGEPSEYTFYVPEAENAKLRGYVKTLETANLDVTSRLQDYIGQYDPTDAFVIEVKAQNDKLRELVRRWYPHMVKRVSWDALSQWGDLQVMREVGIEVER